MHMLNHVGHFPMAIGAARLSSMVVEHDDVPGLSPDELSVQIFSAPNIQVCTHEHDVQCYVFCKILVKLL